MTIGRNMSEDDICYLRAKLSDMAFEMKCVANANDWHQLDEIVDLVYVAVAKMDRLRS